MQVSQVLQPVVLIAATTCFVTSAGADVVFFFLDEGDQGAWKQALRDHRRDLASTGDFGTICDPSVVAIDGPVCHPGHGDCIPAEALPERVCVDSNINPYGVGGRGGRGAGGSGLRIIGRSAGFGNETSAITSGYYVDSYDIFSDAQYTAMEIDVITLLGSDRAVITVYDLNENAMAQVQVNAPPTGNRIGILGTGGDILSRVNLYDEEGGVEGLQGLFHVYTGGAPVPAELTDFEVVTGTHRSGNVEDLSSSDDAYVMSISGHGSRLSEAHLMEILISARTAERIRNRLNVAVESRISEPGGTATIRFRNWQTGEFDRIGQYQIGLEEEVIKFEGVIAADYVRPSGAVELSIKHVVFVPFLAFRFESFFDWVEIAVE